MRMASELFSSPGPGDPRSLIVLDFPVTPKPRFFPGNPHPKLFDILNRGRDAYKSQLKSDFYPYRADFNRILSSAITRDETEPSWLRQ